MSCRHFVLAFGAAAGATLGAALFTSPAAYAANEVFPPGSAPAGPPIDVTDYQLGPWFDYHQFTTPSNVVDDGAVTGTFDLTQGHWGVGFLHHSYEVVADGTGTASAWTGSVDDSYSLLAVAPLGGYLTIFGNDYLQTPDGVSDYLTVFNNEFPLFDTFPDDSSATAGADVVDPSWLTDLAALL